MAGQTKGLGFVNVRRFVESHRDVPEAWTQVLGRLGPADREVADSAMATSWYALEAYVHLIRAVADVLGEGDLRVVQELGRYEAEQDLTIVHRIFLKLLHPATLAEKTAEYWSRFHDTGAWTATRKTNGYQMILRGWGVVDEALCAELVAYLTRLLELIGVKEPRVRHTECRARGAQACIFEGHWK